MSRLLGLTGLMRRGASEADSRAAPHFAELAESYRAKDLLQEAATVCEEGLKAWPAYVSGHIVMARVHRDAGALDRAEASVRRVLELDPMNAIALSLMGDIALRRGEWENAIRYLEDAVFFAPADTHATELLRLARQRVRPLVVAESPVRAEPARQPPPAPSAPERALTTDVETEIAALRQQPGIEGALLLTSDGLPVSGSLGGGNDSDEEIAALAAGVIAEWARASQLPPPQPRGLAVVEAQGSQLVLAAAGAWILVVSVSRHMRLGRVLGHIRRAMQAIGSEPN